MKKIITYIILWSIVGIGYAQQKQVDLSKQVRVGGAMPSIPPQAVLFYKQDNIMLNDYKDKVLILDFFDTYCSSCIASLPKLQKLQDEMGNQLQIVMVTWQDKGTIEKFWSTNNFVQEHKIHLPMIYSDTLLRQYFPHRVISHVVWAYQGSVQAITHPDFVAGDRIAQLYKGGNIKLPLKYDFEDSGRQHRNGQNSKGSVSLTGFQEGRPTMGYNYGLDSLTGMYRTSFYNLPIFVAYTAVWATIKKPEFILKPERIVWEVRDSSLYKNFGPSGTGKIWLSENGICYERYDQVPRSEKDQAAIVLKDLNALLGLNVYWSTRRMPALVIEGKYKSPGSIVSIDGLKMEGTSVLSFGLDMTGLYPPVIDRVNNKEMLLIPSYEGLKELNDNLKMYGLKVVEKITDVEVLVFQEIDKR
ncbi:peroxiredoxin family protein [Sphingobacterium pedocola]|nr:TlpA disulfide reductase family protein [Sphingobacterium pedocola]